LHAPLEDQFPGIRTPRHESSSRSPDSSKNKKRGKSAPKKVTARRASSASERLQATFGSPSDESERTRNQKKRAVRMDSNVDYGPNGSAAVEVSERLHKLEDSVARIEEMLGSIIEQREQVEREADESGDSNVDEALNQEVETGIHQ
jgi:hypothetical protein